ncbi:MAG: AbrB/MazE/SpoVT family DNA-binding domain-containing protein [Burkholderiales bacterium]
METTRLTSKGQVVIPKTIRDHLHILAGTEFKVTADGRRIILEAVSPKTRRLSEWPGFGRTLPCLSDKSAFAPVDLRESE